MAFLNRKARSPQPDYYELRDRYIADHAAQEQRTLAKVAALTDPIANAFDRLASQLPDDQRRELTLQVFQRIALQAFLAADRSHDEKKRAGIDEHIAHLGHVVATGYGSGHGGTSQCGTEGALQRAIIDESLTAVMQQPTLETKPLD